MAYERELFAIFTYLVDGNQYINNNNRTMELIRRY